MPIKSSVAKHKPTTSTRGHTTFLCIACSDTLKDSNGGQCIPCLKNGRIKVAPVAIRTPAPTPIPPPIKPKKVEYIPPPTDYGEVM